MRSQWPKSQEVGATVVMRRDEYVDPLSLIYLGHGSKRLTFAGLVMLVFKSAGLYYGISRRLNSRGKFGQQRASILFRFLSEYLLRGISIPHTLHNNHQGLGPNHKFRNPGSILSYESSASFSSGYHYWRQRVFP